jgi:hypothetical protein
MGRELLIREIYKIGTSKNLVVKILKRSIKERQRVILKHIMIGREIVKAVLTR